MYKKILLTTAATLFFATTSSQQAFSMNNNKIHEKEKSIFDQKNSLVQAIKENNQDFIIKNYFHCFKRDDSDSINHGSLDSYNLGHLTNIFTAGNWTSIYSVWLFGFEILESLEISLRSFNTSSKVVCQTFQNTGMDIMYTPPQNPKLKSVYKKYEVTKTEDSLNQHLKIKFNKYIKILNEIGSAFCDENNEINNSFDDFLDKKSIENSLDDVIDFIAMTLIHTNEQVKVWNEYRFSSFENLIKKKVENSDKLITFEELVNHLKELNRQLIFRAKEENEKSSKEIENLLKIIEELKEQNHKFFTKILKLSNNSKNKKKKNPTQTNNLNEKSKTTISNQKETINNLQENRKKKDEKILSLNQEVDLLFNEVKELKTKNNSEHQEALKLQKEKYEEKLKSQTKKSNQEHLFLKEINKKHEEDIKKLNRQLSEYQNQAKNKEQTSSKAIDLNEELNETNKKLQKEIVELNKKLKNTMPSKREIFIQKASSLPENWKTEINQIIQKSVQNSLQENQTGENFIMDLQENFDEMLYQLQKSFQQIQTLEQQIQYIETKLKESRKIIETLDLDNKYPMWHENIPQENINVISENNPVIEKIENNEKKEKDEIE